MGEDRPQTSRRRVTVAEASEILGVTVEAVRGRIKRGTLEHERDSGTVYVLLDADQPPTGHQPADDQPTDRSRPAAHEELEDELRDRIRYLERQVEEERDARRRADLLLSRLMDRVPQLEAPASEATEAPEAPQTVEERHRQREPERAEPRSGTSDSRERVEHSSEVLKDWSGDVQGVRRPWWRRVFGG